MPRILLALAALALLFSGTAAAGSKVNIIYPPAADADAVETPAAEPARKIQQNVAVTIVVVRPRALSSYVQFQKWTGFVNQYSGPRYPF